MSLPPWLVALGAFGWACWEMVRIRWSLQSFQWPTARGKVLRADIENEPDRHGNDYFIARLRYTYAVQGDHYEGSRLAFHSTASRRFERVEAAMGGLREGQECRVYFHRRHPQLSVLKPGASGWSYALVTLLLCVALTFMAYQFR